MLTGAYKEIGNFIFRDTDVSDIIVVDVRHFPDERGYFMETYKASDFAQGGIDCLFVQDNQSASSKGVLRGLHFQIARPQAKLVRVVEGSVFDVAVDLREGSPTYGKWEGYVLSAENRRQLFVPRGFAHGFLVLSDYAEFCYKCDDVYQPGDEGGVRWDDPDLNIEWPPMEGDVFFDAKKIVLSCKDAQQPLLRDLTR